MYVRFHGLEYFNGFSQCDVPCHTDLGPTADQPCFELTRTGGCRWEGQILQNATCYPVSTMQVSLNCGPGGVDIVALWVQSGTAFTRYLGHISATAINCLACNQYELQPNFIFPLDNSPGARCRTSSSTLEVSFQPFAKCCQYCPDQYQISITGINQDGPPDNHCGEEDCQQLNQIYLLDFVGTATTPRAPGCSQVFDAGSWCEYATSSFAFRCIQRTTPPHPYGFCSIHLFIRTLDNCTSDVAMEFRFDSNDAGNQCATNNEYVGWVRRNVLQACTFLNVTLTKNNRCSDLSWMCDDGHLIGSESDMQAHIQVV